MHGYLSLDIICSSKLTVFLELCSRKTVRFSEQIMSEDKYPCIFSRQMETIVYIIAFRPYCSMVDSNLFNVFVILLLTAARLFFKVTVLVLTVRAESKWSRWRPPSVASVDYIPNSKLFATPNSNFFDSLVPIRLSRTRKYCRYFFSPH